MIRRRRRTASRAARSAAFHAALLLAGVGACGPGGTGTGTGGDTLETPSPGGAGEETSRPGGPHPVRFVLSTSPDVAGPVVLQMNDALNPVAWLRILQTDGTPVRYTERCEIPACGQTPAAVCSAAIPRTRVLAAGDSAVHLWDGTVSRITEDGCEVLEPAPGGTYVGRFCRGTAIAATGPPGAGLVVDESCTDRTFALPGTRELRVVIPQD